MPALAARDCANGQVLYNKPVSGLACATSTCHNSDPSRNANRILAGAYNPLSIAGAIGRGAGGMQIFQGKFSDSDLDDIGTWIGVAPAPCSDGFPELSISPTSSAYAPQFVGTTSPPIAISVISTGALPVTLVSLGNANAAEFPASTTCPATMPNGASCTINVSFKPSAAGARSGTLLVNNLAGIKLINLSGTGASASGNAFDLVEYYYAEFDSYFVTSLAGEIQKLDRGDFVGWARTGLQFKIHSLGTPGSLTVCRFYSVAFGAKSAHFYTPASDECALLKSNPDWIFEGEVFAIPGARADGSCGTGTVPVYRLYNNGQGGAPNHRYTTVATVRDTMIAAGWILEGNGPGFAFMCAPQ